MQTQFYWSKELKYDAYRRISTDFIKNIPENEEMNREKKIL